MACVLNHGASGFTIHSDPDSYGKHGWMMSYLVMRLRGRLGNNLWQFASGLGIARALGARLCFDSRPVQAHLRLLQELIPGTYEEATPAELRRVGVGPRGRGRRALVKRCALSHASDLERRVRHQRPARLTLYDGDDAFRNE